MSGQHFLQNICSQCFLNTQERDLCSLQGGAWRHRHRGGEGGGELGGGVGEEFGGGGTYFLGTHDISVVSTIFAHIFGHISGDAHINRYQL